MQYHQQYNRDGDEIIYVVKMKSSSETEVLHQSYSNPLTLPQSNSTNESRWRMLKNDYIHSDSGLPAPLRKHVYTQNASAPTSAQVCAKLKFVQCMSKDVSSK